MSDQSAIVPVPAREMRATEYFKHSVIQQNFAAVLGSQRAYRFLTGVLIAVSESEALMNCTLPSIYRSAMRAATLGLSVDPATKQAYLVPFKNKGEEVCTLIVGWKGLYDMAMRTGQYRWINVRKTYKGEVWSEDPASGLLSHLGAPIKKDDKDIIGWYAGFQTFSGTTKQIYMTVDEIHEHAKKFSKSYNLPTSGWKTNTREMERKTILRQLLSKWGYLDPADKEALDAEDSSFEPPTILPAEDEEERTASEAYRELGYGEMPTKVRWQDLKAPANEHDADTFLASASQLTPEAGAILDRFKGNAKQAWEHVKANHG